MDSTAFTITKNNATGTLLADIAVGATSLELLNSTQASLFPSSGDGQFWYTIHLDQANPSLFEIGKATRSTGNTFTLNTRGLDGGAAQAWPAGAVFSMYIPRGKILEWETKILNHSHSGGNDGANIGVSSIVKNETPSGSVNGSNTTFTCATTFVAGSLEVYLNGQRLVAGASDDFQENGGATGFTMTFAPSTGDKLRVSYGTQPSIFATGSASFVYNETPSGSINSSNLVFTSAFAFVAGTLEVWLNGLLMAQGASADYVETTPASGTFTFNSGQTPQTGDTIIIKYQKSVSVAGNADLVDGYHASPTPAASTIPVQDAEGNLLAGIKGEVKIYAGASAPTGWLLCDGSPISRTTYADLFDVIGTSFGTGDGSTTFNLPDLRDKFAIGKSGTKALGSTGGAATVNLAHTHSTPNHVHKWAYTGSNQGDWTSWQSDGSGTRQITTGNAGSSSGALTDLMMDSLSLANTSFYTENGGAGVSGSSLSSSQSVLNPYLALNYIIKY